MLFNMKCQPLIEKYKETREAEAEAIRSLLQYMQEGGRDDSVLGVLTDQMESTHNAAMDVYDSLQKFRLDTR
ncbi:MAG: hypothetical protein JWQ01_1464 [Massilia sp.]|nr:hypothetical protein [Massilia sp.]